MEKIGPALGNYKRSPALIYQIYLIHKLEHPMIDYLFFSSSDNAYPFVVSDMVMKCYFRQCREEAMTTGDRTAIAMLGEFVSYIYSKSSAGPTRQDIMKQLSNEYGFDVNAAVLELDEERANDPQGLTMLQRETEDFRSSMRDLLSNPALAEERDDFLKESVLQLTGKMKW
jgi:hypothetical protein